MHPPNLQSSLPLTCPTHCFEVWHCLPCQQLGVCWHGRLRMDRGLMVKATTSTSWFRAVRRNLSCELAVCCHNMGHEDFRLFQVVQRASAPAIKFVRSRRKEERTGVGRLFSLSHQQFATGSVTDSLIKNFLPVQPVLVTLTTDCVYEPRQDGSRRHRFPQARRLIAIECTRSLHDTVSTASVSGVCPATYTFHL